jgi:hypothetical protein
MYHPALSCAPPLLAKRCSLPSGEMIFGGTSPAPEMAARNCSIELVIACAPVKQMHWLGELVAAQRAGEIRAKLAVPLKVIAEAGLGRADASARRGARGEAAEPPRLVLRDDSGLRSCCQLRRMTTSKARPRHQRAGFRLCGSWLNAPPRAGALEGLRARSAAARQLSSLRRWRIMSDTRLPGTPMAAPKARAERPSGFMNSSASTSPG